MTFSINMVPCLSYGKQYVGSVIIEVSPCEKMGSVIILGILLSMFSL